jgi:ubiquinone/menaquinone biosynthesis C-methylase UbiE
MYRVLKPGGRLLVLEFSKPIIEPLSKAYDAYSFHVLPRVGNWWPKTVKAIATWRNLFVCTRIRTP